MTPRPAAHRPTPTEWRAFATQALQAAGLGSLGAGVLFFVAANWQAWGLVGRFALLQTGLLTCIALALWRPSPQRIGQGALLLAILVSGAALALFGQSYQTGADVYELFLTWAVLTLPFALAGSGAAAWALWWAVFNIGMALLCGGLSLEHVVWRAIGGSGVDRTALLMAPCLVDLLAAGGVAMLHGPRFAALASTWLPRYLTTLGVAFGTAAALPFPGRGSAVLVLYAAVSIALALGLGWRRRDVFPLTLLAGSWIVIATVGLVTALRLNDVGGLFVVALWLIVSSTIAGGLLMRCFRRWQADVTEGAAS